MGVGDITSAAAADRLRALAHDHAEGRLSTAAYRRLRAPLIDELAGFVNQPPPDTTQPRGGQLRPNAETAVGSPAVSPTPAPPPPPDASPDELSRQQNSTARPGGRAGLVAVSAAIVASIAVVLVWRHETQKHTAAGSVASDHAVESADPIRTLLQPLIDSPDWGDARLTDLNRELLKAGPTRIAAEQNADWFNGFVDQVRSRVKEQQALQGSPLSPGRSPLAALAITLGINLTAPDRPIQIGAVASPTAVSSTEQASPAPAHTSASPVPAVPPAPVQTAVAPHKPLAGAGTAASARVAGASIAKVARASSRTAASGSSRTPQEAAAPLGAGGRATRLAQTSSADTTSSAPPASTHLHSASDASGVVQCSAALLHTRRTFCRDVLPTGALAPLLAVIPAGSFQMGNDKAEAERPVHRVTIQHPFAMSVYEVSQGEFQQYCRVAGKVCPSQPWLADDYPVVEVNWNDARNYARWLSQATGQLYRLPTEAEWEYAARAGRVGLYPSGDTLSPADAYFSKAETLTAPARRDQPFNANAWRLLNMVGNVREWVEDGWIPNFSGAPTDGSAWQDGSGEIKVVRGGSYADHEIELRLTTRGPLPASTRDKLTGIRLVREIR